MKYITYMQKTKKMKNQTTKKEHADTDETKLRDTIFQAEIV